MELILKRDLIFNENQEITILIYAPIKNDDNSYSCNFQFLGFKSEKIRKSVGVDSIQSLILSLKKIGSELYNSDEYIDKKIRWDCELFEGDLGFPTLEGFR